MVKTKGMNGKRSKCTKCPIMTGKLSGFHLKVSSKTFWLRRLMKKSAIFFDGEVLGQVRLTSTCNE